MVRWRKRPRSERSGGAPPPSPVFSQVLILKGIEVFCFVADLQVLILNGLRSGPLHTALGVNEKILGGVVHTPRVFA
jgi:hypothetical protein